MQVRFAIQGEAQSTDVSVLLRASRDPLLFELLIIIFKTGV